MASLLSDFTKPVALVTGGSSFLGKAISHQLGQKGYNLVLHYQKSVKKAKELVDDLKMAGIQARLVQADLRKVDQMSSLIQQASKFFKRLDLLVNNASLFYPTPLFKTQPGQWEEIFKVNLFSPYFLSCAAAPWLKKTKGCVVNLTDIYGESPILKDYSAYCASKSGLITLTKILARELGPFIRVNAVSPGAIFIPKNYSPKKQKELIERSALKRQGSPEDIAETVYFLTTQQFITGQIIKVDGGRFV
jgi:pteridine reductase